MDRLALPLHAALSGCVLLLACGAPAKSRTPIESKPGGALTIRSIDFDNHTYPSCFEGAPPVEAKDGRAGEVDELGDGSEFTIASVAYGDVDGDRVDDAVVLAQCLITAVSREGPAAVAWVFTMRASGETLLGSIEVHDGEAARVEDGAILIDATVRDEETLDPVGQEVQVWRWDGRAFVREER